MIQMPDEAENQTERILQESLDVTSTNMTLTNTTSTDKGLKNNFNNNTTKVPVPSLVSEAYSMETAYAQKTKKPAIAADRQIQPGPRIPNGTHAYKV